MPKYENPAKKKVNFLQDSLCYWYRLFSASHGKTAERRKSLQRAFMPAKNQAHWKNVLIIDDIYTTGSTIDAVSRVLKETQRAEAIYFLTIAIGIGNN